MNHSDVWCPVDPCPTCREEAEERENDRHYDELYERKREKEAEKRRAAKMSGTMMKTGPRSYVSYGEWREALLKIVQEGDFSNWKLGEWLFIGQEAHGETYAQAVSDAGISPAKALAALYTYQRFPLPSSRIADVKWSMHREVAGLPLPSARIEWLNKVKDNNWTVSELKTAMREAGIVKQRVKLATPKVQACPSCGITLICPNQSCGGGK